MISFKRSVATRLALVYGVLVAASITVVSAIFYFGTIGVFNQSTDGKIVKISNRLVGMYQFRPLNMLSQAIDKQLTDGIDSDTEIYLLVSPEGQRLAGNISTWPSQAAPLDQLINSHVIRDGKPSSARLIIRNLPNGARLFVGVDIGEQELIRNLVMRALLWGAGISLILVIAGAIYFLRRIQGPIGDIRRTALEIEAGDLTKRIPTASDDEFGRLSVDINRMLDRIEQLMDGVRHVSNAIAHDLRTPLSRIRSKLDEATRHHATVVELHDAANAAIEDIDELIRIFEKLLQIAEAESGMRTRSFDAVDLGRIVHDMIELYDATAEEHRVTLMSSKNSCHSLLTAGDRNLLASAVASLIDNAIKYVGTGGTVLAGVYASDKSVSIVVRDNGPGIPHEELPNVTKRFYRLDRSRHLPGNGLGLSIVSAIASLHGGALNLENNHPGLIASIVLPLEISAES